METRQCLSNWVEGKYHTIFKLHRRHCIYPSLVLVQPRKTRSSLTERLLMGCKESKQNNIVILV